MTSKNLVEAHLEDKWFTYVSSAEKSALIEDGKRKVHYKLPDGNEMVEEYSMETNVLLRRAWKVKRGLSGCEKWEVELGDPIAQFDNLDNVAIKESSDAPILTKRLTKTAIEWRIRNLPYPRQIFSVTIDAGKICVRTSNKKYFKRISIPELERVGLSPVDDSLTFSHQFNTLIITYRKPPKVLELESKILDCVKKVTPRNMGDVPSDCRPS